MIKGYVARSLPRPITLSDSLPLVQALTSTQNTCNRFIILVSFTVIFFYNWVWGCTSDSSIDRSYNRSVWLVLLFLLIDLIFHVKIVWREAEVSVSCWDIMLLWVYVMCFGDFIQGLFFLNVLKWKWTSLTGVKANLGRWLIYGNGNNWVPSKPNTFILFCFTYFKCECNVRIFYVVVCVCIVLFRCVCVCMYVVFWMYVVELQI